MSGLKHSPTVTKGDELTVPVTKKPSVVAARTAMMTPTGTHSPEITIPAIASPRPYCLPPLVLTSAMIPKITPSGTQLRRPSTNAAMAQPLVERGGGYGYGDGSCQAGGAPGLCGGYPAGPRYGYGGWYGPGPGSGSCGDVTVLATLA